MPAVLEAPAVLRATQDAFDRASHVLLATTTFADPSDHAKRIEATGEKDSAAAQPVKRNGAGPSQQGTAHWRAPKRPVAGVELSNTLHNTNYTHSPHESKRQPSRPGPPPPQALRPASRSRQFGSLRAPRVRSAANDE